MARRRSLKGKRKQAFKLKLSQSTLYSLASLGLIVIGGLILLSLARPNPTLELVFNFCWQYFGWGTFLLPFVFLSAGMMLTRLKWRVAKPSVFLGSLILLLSSIALTRAGTLGSLIWTSLSELIFGLGAGLVLLAGLVIGLVIMLETSLEDILLGLDNFKTKLSQWLSQFKNRPAMPQGNAQEGFTVKGLDTQPESKPAPVMPLPNKPLPATMSLPVTTKIGAQQKMWQYPPVSLLSDMAGGKADRGDVKQNAHIIETTLESFGIGAQVVEVNNGPAVTQYAIRIKEGTKLSKITSLQNDLALALSAPQGQIRIEAPIPGRNLVGLEIPNRSLEIVSLKKMLSSRELKQVKSKLAVALGLNVSGEPIIVDIDRMPHVLIAGSTGSGKSVAINSFITTMLFRATPEEVKFILVDPKRVELTIYNDIPHLLTPVIVEPEKVISALKWAISEMEHRYKQFAEVGARNIAGFNELSGFQAMPYIVIVIDELADIILFAPSEVEDRITRLAQMARATGIHLVLATQRPSVDVLTGLIKANINCRIAFNVNSMVDSRVIIDTPGAEKLLGRGDMLYIPPEQAKPSRIQGTFISDNDAKKLVAFLRQSETKVEYTEAVTERFPVGSLPGAAGGSQEEDPLFNEALRMVVREKKASASLLQRRLSIGYARAARILDQMQLVGAIGPGEGSKARDILIPDAEEFILSRQSQ
ncbi:MAG TPA: DNA translocase FtsK [Patescibacteria group bacterium]|nr:DNA translocase FtsK [Patescibacteria group bacterium]